MKLGWTIVVALAACGPKAATAPAMGNQGAPAAHGAPTPCPDTDALDAAALAAWGKSEGRTDAVCVAFWSGGEPLWVIEGWYYPPEESDTIGGWTAVVTPAGVVRHRDGDDELPWGASERSYHSPASAADLDGDGDDELVFEEGYEHMGYAQSSVSVASFASGALVETEDLPLSFDNTGADEDPSEAVACEGSYRLVDGPDATKRIEVTGTGDGREECAPAGVHLYAWNGSGLVEVLGSR